MSRRWSNISRRNFIGVGAALTGAGLTGCLDGNGDDGNGDETGANTVAEATPVGQPVDSSGVSWDDLGDLEGEITVYSGRTADQIDLVFDRLEQEYDDLTVDRDYGDNDTQVTQITQVEGEDTPADIFYSQDPGALGAVADAGLAQELPEDIVDAIPATYRHPDGLWTGVSGRVRSVMYNEDRLADETPFDDGDDLPTDVFAYAEDDRFEGIISTRPNSGTFRGFIQAMMELEGEQATRDWVNDFLDQDPTLFSSGSDQAVAVNRGGEDDPIVALGNSYYAARIVNEDPDAPIRVTFTEGDAGALFSVAGITPTVNADNPELVAEFVRHLLAVEGQEFMMEDNGEFPVIEGVDYVGPLPGPDELDSPDFDLSEFDTELEEARELLEDEGMLPL